MRIRKRENKVQEKVIKSREKEYIDSKNNRREEKGKKERFEQERRGKKSSQGKQYKLGIERNTKLHDMWSIAGLVM